MSYRSRQTTYILPAGKPNALTLNEDNGALTPPAAPTAIVAPHLPHADAVSTEIVAQDVDNPALFAALLNVRSPANPLAVVNVIRGHGMAPTENVGAVIAQVLGAPLATLLSDQHSVLYANTAALLARAPRVATTITAPAGAPDKSAIVPAVIELQHTLDKLPLVPLDKIQKVGQIPALAVPGLLPPTQAKPADDAAAQRDAFEIARVRVVLEASGVTCALWLATEARRVAWLVLYRLAPDEESARALALRVTAACTGPSLPLPLPHPVRPPVLPPTLHSPASATLAELVRRGSDCDWWRSINTDENRARSLIAMGLATPENADALAQEVTNLCGHGLAPPMPVPPRQATPPTPPHQNDLLATLGRLGVKCEHWVVLTEDRRRAQLIAWNWASDATAPALAQRITELCATRNTTPVSGVRDAMRAENVTCDAWHSWSQQQRVVFILGRGLAPSESAVGLAEAVLAGCPPPAPQVAQTVGQRALRDLGISCQDWLALDLAAQVRRLGTRIARQALGESRGSVDLASNRIRQEFGPASEVILLTDAQLQSLAQDMTAECISQSNDWARFLRWLQPPSDNPAHSPRSCNGFLAMNRAQQIEMFTRSGWRPEHVQDGLVRLNAWCNARSSLDQAAVDLCRAGVHWQVRAELITATRRVMRPLTLDRLLDDPARQGRPRAELESDWERGLWAIPNVASSLPALCQQVYSHCDRFARGPATEADPEARGVLAWLSLGEVLPQGGFDALDPVQGAVGDCYLISAMSAIAWCRPGLLESLIRRIGPDPVGGGATRYGVRIRGEEQIVSDTFPMSPYRFIPMFARSIRENAWWPALIEKAYAKWRTRDRTDHPAITANGAWSEEPSIRPDARRSVGGVGSVEFPAADLVGGEMFWWLTYNRSSESVWQRLRAMCDGTGKITTPVQAGTWPMPGSGGVRGFFMDIAMPTGIGTVGLAPQHAYTILGVGLSNWAGGDGSRYVIIRNPWGFVASPRYTTAEIAAADDGGRGRTNLPGTTNLDPSILPPRAFTDRRWNGLDVSGNANGVVAIMASAFARHFASIYGTRL